MLRVFVLFFSALFSMLLALRVGASGASLLQAITHPHSLDAAILEARFARVVLGAIAGGALAMVGAAFQALLRNPLGDPYALGVSGGAALGASIAVVLGFNALLVPTAAFLGAMGATFMVLAAARAAGRTDAAGLLLAGLVFNAFANAALTLLRSLTASTKAQETLSLLLGFVAEERWSTVALVAVLVLLGAVLLGLLSKPMNLLALGEESAASLGVSVRSTEIAIFLAASIVIGGVVSVCGLIPFVGLVVPHYVRSFVGSDHRKLLPGCFFAGASLLVLADAGTRGLFLIAGAEPPVGALTALLGAPFFLFVLRKDR